MITVVMIQLVLSVLAVVTVDTAVIVDINIEAVDTKVKIEIVTEIGIEIGMGITASIGIDL